MKYQVVEIMHKVNVIKADSKEEAVKKFYEQYTDADVLVEEVEVYKIKEVGE